MASSFDCTKEECFASINLKNPPLLKTQKLKVTGVDKTLDRLSELPDSLLVQILSLLPTTKYAVRTCILSKRWLYLWTFLYNFSFTAKDFRNIRNSVSFVDYVFAHSATSKIKKLKIQCNRGKINHCLSFAVEKNVEDVVIEADDERGCTFTESFCNYSSLITLHIRCFEFDFDGVLSWKSLKSLRLENLGLSDDDIVNLLSGCPALVTLELYAVEGVKRLEISSRNLRRLKLILSRYGNEHSLDIIAPYLQYLEISGDHCDLKCRLVDVSSVVHAKLTFHIECIKAGEESSDDDEEKDSCCDYHKDCTSSDDDDEEDSCCDYHKDCTSSDDDEEEDSCCDYHKDCTTLVADYLNKLSDATTLTIGTWFTQVLCMLQLKLVPIPELKCKYLTLELHTQNFNLYGAAVFLQASPHVETLNINMLTKDLFDSLCHFELSEVAKGDNIDMQSFISSFVFPNLKKVKFVISFKFRGLFSNPCDVFVCLKDHLNWAFDKLLKLSEFLLKAATVLEEFVIISKRRKCRKCSENCQSRYLSRLAEKLMGCPRSSAKCMIIFKE